MSANSKKIGNVEKYEETRVEWKIAHFFSVIEDKSLCYESLAFPFAGDSWYLQMNFDNEYIILNLCNDNPREYSVEFNFGIRKLDGTVEDWLGKGIMEGNQMYDEDHFEFLRLSELQQRKSKLVPSDVLTVTCTVKRETTESDQQNTSHKPSFIKLISK